jgi:hypothetical protein
MEFTSKLLTADGPVDWARKYLAFVLDDASRKEILGYFKPKYRKIDCHHITVQFNLTEDSQTLIDTLKNASLEVVGYQYGEGVDCVAIEVNGSTKRPDGKIYHVTLSLKGGHTAVESNAVLQAQGIQHTLPFPIAGTLELLDK